MSSEVSPQTTLQSIILRLQHFWADQGCLIWQPYHTEVGAGTMNPATFLRVLGPEPWWVAYVEPSFRPADGRYGENPNRWQHYYQFQVILKPDPGDPQERYLESLVALGIDPAQHDIRFVEDNWQAPTIGAWGLGWEVWLDGQEITQFTYFQQAGGQTLDPVSVEITYGLERIALALQGAETFLDLRWDGHLTYGEAKLRSEFEYCTYNFEVADVEHLKQMYDLYEGEARRALENDLIQPAHDYVLKCSHAFNLLDARGAVGVTERAAFFGRMRDLAQEVALGYERQRAEEGHPWMDRWSAPPLAEVTADAEPVDEAAPFLLEVGTEELPPADLTAALEQLREAIPRVLDELRLEHEGVKVSGTPRRLVVEVEGLNPEQRERVSQSKGPPAERAFNDAGDPTQAAIGFAKGQGLAVEELKVQEVDGGRYVVAEVSEAGRPSVEVLAEALPQILSELTFGRSMRWNASGVAFARPVRWLVALHGERVVPFEFAGVVSGRRTRGLRFEESEWVELGSPADFRQAMEERSVLLDDQSRREEIRRQVQALAEEVDGQVVDDPDLLEEVTHLVEVPTAIRGQFDEEFLDLPRPVLISVMRKHQRYFALEREGELLPYFVTVRNGGEQGTEIVRKGNEQVLKARFADASFFVERDLEIGLQAYLPRLDTLTFESSLGSMRDKVERVERLVEKLADDLGLSADKLSAARRAAHLSKADLASEMVVEMTDLQGEMGSIYALEAGEPEEVAIAIAEHYLPRFSGDRVPQTDVGFVLGVADRLDSLIGLFAAGMDPSGAGDPFALRRTAIGLVEMLVAHDRSFDMNRGLEVAAAGLPIEAGGEDVSRCLEFVGRRQRGILRGEGYRHDVVEAVLAEQAHNPALAARGVGALTAWVERQDWPELLDNFARCARITRDQESELPFDPNALVEPAEEALYAAYQEAAASERDEGSVEDFLNAFEPLVPSIQRFFDEVLVMTDDEKLRRNRLALLQRIVGLSEGVADLSQMEGF